MSCLGCIHVYLFPVDILPYAGGVGEQYGRRRPRHGQQEVLRRNQGQIYHHICQKRSAMCVCRRGSSGCMGAPPPPHFHQKEGRAPVVSALVVHHALSCFQKS